MAYEQKDGEGSLFVNDKRTTDQHPMYKGSVKIHGQEFWVSGWLNTAKSSGAQYIGLKVQPKEVQSEAAVVQQVQSAFPGAKPVDPGPSGPDAYGADPDDSVPDWGP